LITGAQAKAAVPVATIIGRRVETVEARAKHLLVRFDSGTVLHTHMRMTGSWHVYRAGERWRKPGEQARLVLETGDRLAVCFNAPVIELLTAPGERVHPALSSLGPDVLVEPLDLSEVRRRSSTRPGDLPVGELLLDQRIVSGIGNIYRCESLFVERVSPWTPRQALDDETLDALVSTAATLMRSNLEPGRRWYAPRVYGRTGRPCLRCRHPVRSARLGEQPRTIYWCDTCQPRATRDLTKKAGLHGRVRRLGSAG
jgi:endonuclease-8